MAEQQDNISKAWDKVKGDGDAPYAEARPELKADLQDRADGITRTGATTLQASGGDREPTVYDKFEEEFQRLNKSASAKTESSATDEDDDKIEEDKESLSGKSRAELEEIASGLGVEDTSKEAFPNMELLREEIEKRRAK